MDIDFNNFDETTFESVQAESEKGSGGLGALNDIFSGVFSTQKSHHKHRIEDGYD